LQKVLAVGLTPNRDGPPTGALAHDIELLRPGIAAFLGSIATGGPELLATRRASCSRVRKRKSTISSPRAGIVRRIGSSSPRRFFSRMHGFSPKPA
jgi:hypothetical protein